MSHDHPDCAGASPREYLVGQLLTVAAVGVFGLVGVLMYRDGQLGYVLALPFHRPVLIGGVVLLGLVILRAVGLWREAGRLLRRDPDPDDHGHGHDLAWVFSRLAILSFPVGLFLIGVPNSGFSQDRIRMLLGGDDALTIDVVAATHQDGTVTAFRELVDAAGSEDGRAAVVGQTAVLEGRINRIDTRQFTLFRLKMVCCAADTVPLKVWVVLASGTLSGFDDFDWVRMTGRVRFVQAPNSERYIPVVVVEDVRDVRKIAPGAGYD